MQRKLIALFVFGALSVQAEDFVLKRNKKPSTNVLRENCCDSFLCAVKESPKAARNLAEIQELSFSILPDVVEGAYFNGMAKDTLSGRAKKIEQFKDRQATINKLIQEQLACAKELVANSN